VKHWDLTMEPPSPALSFSTCNSMPGETGETQ